MKRNLFCILLWLFVASISIYVPLSEPAVKIFGTYSNEEGKTWVAIAWFFMLYSLSLRKVIINLADIFFGSDSMKNNESKYQTRLPDDVNESVLAKGTSEAGISTPVDLHEAVFRKALFNYYNTKYLGPYNYSSGEECVKDAILDAAKGRHLKNEEINSITDEIMSCLDYCALRPYSNPPHLAEWLDYTYMCLEEIEMDYDFQSLVTRKLRREGRSNKGGIR